MPRRPGDPHATMWVFLAVAGASALAGAGTATTTGKSATYLISCLVVLC